jgi:hypothetical protein
MFVLIGLVLVLALVAPRPVSGATRSPGERWGLQDQLYGVAALSRTDAWAVGRDCVRACGAGELPQATRSFIVHWNGLEWSPVASPNVSVQGYNTLSAVAARSARDVWAVGSYTTPGTFAFNAMIMHWNGASWRLATSPSPGNLASVSIVSAADAWAVGSGPNGSLIVHWNGHKWSTVPAPTSIQWTGSALTGVSAVSATDVWAVGTYDTNQTPEGQTLILHWNGSAWSVVPSPDPSLNASQLTSVSAVSAGDVWAVGDYCTLYSGGCAVTSWNTVILQWNGHLWSQVPSPNPGSFSQFYGVSARGGFPWAVGTTARGNAPYYSLIARLNAGTWSHVRSPSITPIFNFLYGVSATSSTDAWAVGYDCVQGCGGDETDNAVLMHWNGTRWRMLVG